MKTHFKRLLSLALAVVMVFGILPMNALPAQAADTLTVSAYPAKVAVGQESQIFIKGENNVSITEGFTAVSSNDAIAKVVGTKLVGVHSGTATISVTDSTGATGSFDVEVTTVSEYVISSHSFNIGLDKDKDGTVDHFGGTTITPEDGAGNVKEPTFTPNNFTLDVNKYIPFVVTGTYKQTYSGKYQGLDINLNEALWYSARPHEMWQKIMPMYTASAYAANEKYFTSYDYLNLDKTAPWQWMGNYTRLGTYDIQAATTWIQEEYAQVTRGQATFGNSTRWNYITIKLKVPTSGNYKIEVDTGKTAGIREYFYLSTTAPSTNNTYFQNNSYKLFDIDLGAGNTTGSTERYLEAGDYYFVAHFCGDTTVATSKSTVGYLSSITLTYEELDEPVISASNAVAIGTQGTLKVTQKSSVKGDVTLSNATFECKNPDVLQMDVKDGVATITGLKEGTAEVTATYTDLSGKECNDTVTIVVNAYGELNYKFTIQSFNIGVDTDHDGDIDAWGDSNSVAVDGYDISPDNTWTDKTADKFLPYFTSTNKSDAYASTYTDANGNNYQQSNAVYYRGRHRGWQIDVNTFELPSLSYDYLNDSTDQWRWAFGKTTGMGERNIINGSLVMYPSANVNLGSEPYAVLIVNVPVAGTYNIDVSASGSHNMHFYMMPINASSGSDRAYFTNSEYYKGNLDTYTTTAGTLTNTLVAEAPGEYYLVVKLGNDGAFSKSNHASASTGIMFSFLNSVKLTRNVIEPSQIHHQSGEMSLGSYSTISVTQNQTFGGLTTFTDVTYENSNPDVLNVIVRKGAATLTAIGTGDADITVSYTDLYGVERTSVLSYTVTSKSYTYNISENVFNYGNDTDGDGTVDEFGSDVMSDLDDGDKTATKHIGFHATTYGGKVARFLTSRVMFYPWNGNGYLYMTPEYQNPKMTDPWSWMGDYPFWNNLTGMTTGSYLQIGDAWVQHAGVSESNKPHFTVKLEVPASGTYHVSVNTGHKSANNVYFFLIPANEGTFTTVADLQNEDYKLGSIDNAAGETTKTFTKYSLDTADKGIKLDKGSYYFVTMADNDTEKSASATASGLFFLKQITLTPVFSGQDDFTVGQQAVLGKNIKLNLTVNPTGSMIGGYKVFFEDELLTSFDVEFGKSESLSVALSANQMSREIIFQAVDGEGNDIGEPKVITLREYLKDIIEGKVTATEEEIEMAKHTYNYCAKAQALAKKDLDRLEGYTVDVTIDDPEKFTGELYTGETAGIAPYSMSMLLENTVTLRLYFELTESELADYTFTYNGETLTPAVREDGKVYVDITGINPQLYYEGKSVQVTNTKADNSSLVVTYSPLTYIQRTFHKDGVNAALKDLVKAMYGYHLAAVKCTTN